MASKCYRGDCSESATVVCLFDPKASRAWLSSLEEGADIHPQAFLLCQSHADALVVPQAWALTDLRVVGDPQLATYLARQAEEDAQSDDEAQHDALAEEQSQPDNVIVLDSALSSAGKPAKGSSRKSTQKAKQKSSKGSQGKSSAAGRKTEDSRKQQKQQTRQDVEAEANLDLEDSNLPASDPQVESNIDEDLPLLRRAFRSVSNN